MVWVIRDWFIGKHVITYLITLINTKNKKHIFIGFNALNKAEVFIIKEFLNEGNADIYWDIDICFLEDKIHDAGFLFDNTKRNGTILKPIH